MRTALAQALAAPERIESGVAALDLIQLARLRFEAPDRQTFRCLDLAYQALRAGGTAPAVLNAANEVAVEAFLAGTLPFLAIAEVIELTLAAHSPTAPGNLDDLIYVDLTARNQAQRIMRRSFC
jgi:1-deoxy-D-xylulose-5-phosphate reductoisomerase